MNSPQQINLVTAPGTPYVRLAQDENMRRVVADRGTIICEQHIANLPEVRALGINDFVMDVGAFIGDTALIFGERGCRVVGFEPQIDAYCAAIFNTRDLPFVTIFNLAVGDGEPVECNEDPMAGNSGTRTVVVSPAGTETVRLSKFNYGQRVSFIKIDVEGFEASVVRGALELIAKDLPIILVEIYPALLARQGTTEEDVISPIRDLGYTIEEAIGNRTEPRWDLICRPPSK